MSGTVSPSQSRFTFPSPASPSPKPKHHYTPQTYTRQSSNAHPYAIRTTSTGVLTRSNSITQDHTRHNYVPASPNTHSREKSIEEQKKDFGTAKAHGSGHRYSRSLSNDLGPRPLPSPPTPSNATFAPVEQGDLPANPKHWTPSQLSTYLTTALRVRGGVELPAPVAQDISTFVVRAHINGKAFLRLSEYDLEGYHINPLWRTSLLTASSNLRQNVLKGRIWGFGNSEEVSPTDPEPTKSRFVQGKPRYSGAITTDPESLYESADSSSSLDLSTQTDSKQTTPRSRISGKFRNGRVKGMVKTWEVRTGSESGSASEAEEEADMGGTVRHMPSLASPAADDPIHATVTPHSTGSNSSYGDRPLPALPLHPSLRDIPLPFEHPASLPTPPLQLPTPGPEEELSMDELLRMNGIAPERTRVGKRKAARTKALLDQVNGEEDGADESGGVQAWLAANEGVTVKRVGQDSGSQGKKKSHISASTGNLGSLFESFPHNPGEPTIEEIIVTSSQEDEIEALKHALAATQELAAQLASRVEEYEGRVVQMGALQDELAFEESQEEKKGKERSQDSGVALSITTLEDEDELRRLRQENQELKKKIGELEELSRLEKLPGVRADVPANASAALVKKVWSIFAPFLPQQKAETADNSAARGQAPKRATTDITKAIEEHLRVRALPGYIVLVGIGVCVVCLKVLGRRVLGKR